MQKNITNVKGFNIWGSHIGLKSKRRDLAIIYSTTEASGAAVFTKNLVAAEPIKISRQNIKDGKIRAFVINAGNANACTGKQGKEGALAMMNTAAAELGIKPSEVIIASTGIIGQPFPTEKVVKGIKETVPKLTNRTLAGSLAANAILTTDTFPKEGHIDFKVDGKEINMGGIAKGSGMIHPNMATMLAFIVCDINISHELLDKALRKSVDRSFNMINVDGDTSTNDMVGIMCNGKAGNKKIVLEDDNFEIFQTNLNNICEHFAKLIVSDGEGATKMIEYSITGTRTEEDARKIVRTISDSKLVQTAMFGMDPNWGRILAAAGRSGVQFNPDKTDLFFGFTNKIQLLKNGQPLPFDKKGLKKQMRNPHIKIHLDLHEGQQKAIGWGCDISYEYVRINAEYST
jgi:glutamate N-acetyltransferase / amino-acid N-acetyltransferase